MNHPRFIYGDPNYGYYFNRQHEQWEQVPPPPSPYLIFIQEEHFSHIPIIFHLLVQVEAPFGKYYINSFPGQDPFWHRQELYTGGQFDRYHYTIRNPEIQEGRAMHLYANPPELTYSH